MRNRTYEPLWKRLLGAGLAALLSLSLLAGCSGGSAEPDSSVADPGQESSDENGTTLNYGKGLDDKGVFHGVEALGNVTLPENYQNLKIPEEVSTVSESTLQERIDAVTSAYAQTERVTDRAVKDRDTVNIDYVGSIDGVEFANGSTGGSGTTVTIGVTSYIDDFLEQLIGHKPGETFDVNVTFPDPYPNNPDLANKDAVFRTTINYIEETVEAELTDDYVAEYLQGAYGWTTVEQMKEALRKNLQDSAVLQFLWTEMEEKSVVRSVPQEMLDFQRNLFELQYRVAADARNVTLEELLQSEFDGATLDELAQESQEEMYEEAKMNLILQAIYEDMKLEITEQDIVQYFVENFGTEDYSRYEERFGKQYIYLAVRETVTRDRLLQKVLESNGLA